MSKKPALLSESAILTKVVQKTKGASGWYDSKLSKERARVLDYYEGRLPRRQSEGNSSYVSNDVYDAVEAAKSNLIEVFSGGEDIAQFDPDTDMDVAQCKIATEYCRHIIFRENHGEAVFNDVIHDGLTARVGVAKVYWDKKFKYEDSEFDGLQYDEAMALASQPDVDEFDGEDQGDGSFKGTLTRKKDVSRIVFEALAPEEFLIEARAKNLKSAKFKSHRTSKTRAELLEMDLDPDKVERCATDNERLDWTPEQQSRNEPVDTYGALNDPIQPELEAITLYDSYVNMVIDKAKGACLYRVLHTVDVLFEYEEVDCDPFKVYVPLPVPHIFYGNNFASKVIKTQNARTVLARAILDHTAMTTNPRWAVVKGGLLNPKEMLDNRQGGLVNVRTEGAVTALQVPNMNPFVFELDQKIQQDNEKSTGISSLSQGLNKDAISSQNSQGLMEGLVTLSQQRQKTAARNFVLFFTEVMLEVMRLVSMYEKKQKIIQVAGNWVPVDPRYWTERKGCTVSMHLGYGEKDRAVQKRVEFYKLVEGSPRLSRFMTDQNAYDLVHDTAKLSGIPNVTQYITTPDKVPPPQPDPLKVKELEIKDKAASATMLQAQAAGAKVQRSALHDAQNVELKRNDQMLKALANDRDDDRQDAETASRIEIAHREMDLEESMPDSARKAIVAPNP